jgi:DUF4097 and DUF4098 domain-containing protein YvlB
MKRISKVTLILLIVFLISSMLAIITGPAILISQGFESENIYYHEEAPLTGVNALQISVSDADVKIYPVKGEYFEINLTGNYAGNEYGSNVNLSIEKMGENLEIKVVYPKVNLVIINRDFTLYVGIPENYTEDIKVTSDSGDIFINNISTKKFEIDTASGEIKISEMNSSINSNIRSSSGDIKIEEFNSEEIEIKSISGEIFCENIKSKNGFNVETSSGDINIKNLENSEGNFKSISGEINLVSLEKINSIITSSGNIKIISYLINNNLNIKTVSGEVELDLKEDSSIDLEFESVSGYLKNHFGDIYEGENKVYVKTSSGDLSIY